MVICRCCNHLALAVAIYSCIWQISIPELWQDKVLWSYCMMDQWYLEYWCVLVLLLSALSYCSLYLLSLLYVLLAVLQYIFKLDTYFVIFWPQALFYALFLRSRFLNVVSSYGNHICELTRIERVSKAFQTTWPQWKCWSISSAFVLSHPL